VASSDDSERSKRYLDTLYDHSKQLVTLSTASATVFIALYPSNISVPKLVISLALLALSVVCGVFCLAFVTSMIGDDQNYSSGGRLTATPANKKTIALSFCHVLCVGFLLIGVYTFAIWKFAPLTFEPPTTPQGPNTMTELREPNTEHAKGHLHFIPGPSHAPHDASEEAQETATERPWWRRVFGS
jgi:hypothetical protein